MRRWFTKKLIDTYGDRFDYVAILTDFSINGSSYGTGAHFSVKNHVGNIGQMVFDKTHKFGSAGRLKGGGFLSSVTGWQSNPDSLTIPTRTHGPVSLFYHEVFAHHWGIKGLPEDIQGSPGHLSQSVVHPHIKKSPLRAKPWSEVSPGMFKTPLYTPAIGQISPRFHPLLMYSGGLMTPQEVKEVLYVDFGIEGQPSTNPAPGILKKISMNKIVDNWGGERVYHSNAEFSVKVTTSKQVYSQNESVIVHISAKSASGLKNMWFKYYAGGWKKVTIPANGEKRFRKKYVLPETFSKNEHTITAGATDMKGFDTSFDLVYTEGLDADHKHTFTVQ